jgi:hypothetical protein
VKYGWWKEVREFHERNGFLLIGYSEGFCKIYNYAELSFG